MKLINNDNHYTWGSKPDKLPKQFKKCDHSWRELSELEKNGQISTHECVLCGLEKDNSWEPPIYGYNQKLLEPEPDI